MGIYKRLYESRKKIYTYATKGFIATLLSLLIYFGALGEYTTVEMWYIDPFTKETTILNETSVIQCEPCDIWFKVTTYNYSIRAPSVLFSFDRNISYETYKVDNRYKNYKDPRALKKFDYSGYWFPNASVTIGKITVRKGINESVKFSMKSGTTNIDPKLVGYTVDDFMPSLLSNEADITSGKSEFMFCNPTSFNIPYNDKYASFLFNKIYGDFNTLDVYIGTNVNITKTNRNWIDNIFYIEKTSLNGTKYNETINNGYYEYYNETVEKIDYSPLNSSINYITPKECKRILLKATWDAAIFSIFKSENKAISIDWQPSFNISNTLFSKDQWAWWNASWSYVRPNVITNSSPLIDYQVKIQLNSSYIPNINWSNNGSDLRFTYDDNATVIPHWIEDWVNLSTSNASVWVKTNLTLINMWYGNPSAISTSSISNTFIFGDDFSTGSVPNTTKWNYTSGKWNIVNGTLQGSTTNTSTEHIRVLPSYVSFPSSYIIEAKAKTPKSIDQYLFMYGYKADNNVDNGILIAGGLGGNNQHYAMYKGAWLGSGTASQISSNSWYAMKLLVNGSTAKFSADVNSSTAITSRINTTTATTTSGATAGISSNYVTNQSWDDFRVRKYIPTEPTVLIGAEQSQGGGGDTTPPAMTISSPTNNSNYSTSSMDFNITLNEAGSWAGYSLDGAANVTLVNSTGKWWNTNSSMAQGLHSAVFYANDTAGNMNVSKPNITFRLDNVAPVITINAPTMFQNLSTPPYLNGTITEAQLLHTIKTNNSIYGALDTTSPFNFTNQSYLADGTYTINISANDSVNNVGWANITFRLDMTKPVVTIDVPANGAIFGSVPYINGTVSEAFLHTIKTNDSRFNVLDGSSPFNFTNTSYVADGTITLNISANDTVGNVGWANITFTVDMTKPSAAIISPINNSNYSKTSMDFNLTGSETLSWAGYSLDNGANVTLLNSTGKWWNTNSSMAERLHNVTFYFNDTAGNMNQTGYYYFRLDVTNPSVSVTTPASDGIWYNSVPSITAECTDTNFKNMTGSNSYVATKTTTPATWTNSSALSQGSNSVTITCTDISGNTGNAIRSFNYDSITPVVLIQSPSMFQNLSSPPYLNGTVTDTNLAWIKTNSTIYSTLDSSTPFNFSNQTSVSDGTYTINISANDSANNVGWKNITFRLDMTKPYFSSNSTNSTLAGTTIKHSVLATDETALSGYIFSFDNGTGTFINDTWAAFGATGWANVSKGVNTTTGATIRWFVWANDTVNNKNQSVIYSYVTTSSSTMTTYLNGTSADRFYELGEAINITVCSTVAETGYINSDHPNIGNGTLINGTTCATYLWNTSNVVISQFNNSAITQNHSANNISGSSINNITDLQSGSMSLRGYGAGTSWTSLQTNNTIEISQISNNSAELKWTSLSNANDTDWSTSALQTGVEDNYNTTSYLYENYTWNSSWTGVPSGNILYRAKIDSYTATDFYLWNYYDNSWSKTTDYTTGLHNFTIPVYSTTLQNYSTENKPIQVKVDFRDIYGIGTRIYFYEGRIIYENGVISTTYPTNLSIDIGNDGVKDYWMPYSTLQDIYGITDKFKTNVLTKSLIFSRRGTNVTYVDLPCGAQANSMSFNVTGGNGTQTLSKVDNLATPQHYVFSTENSSNTFNLHLPKSSTVSASPVNITLTGHPYYSSSGTLSGGVTTWIAVSSSTYKTTDSKNYDGTNIHLSGKGYNPSGWGSITGTLSLVGDSGTKGSCNSIDYSYSTIHSYSCDISITGIQPIEQVWVTLSTNNPGGEIAATDYYSPYASTYFSNLNQYDANNATNITIWYNGTTLNYQYLPELNSSVTLQVNLSSTNMNSYLSTCTQDPCPIPFTMKTTKRGNVTISGVDVSYTNSISNITFDIANDGVIDGSISGNSIPNNNVTINATGLNSLTQYMSGTCLNRSMPIVATSETAGTMSLSNLVLNYSINSITLNVSAMQKYMASTYNTSEVCYQETANVSTSCGGLNTGGYNVSGWNGGGGTNEGVYDGNWNTYGAPAGLNLAEFYINYSKPLNSVNTSLWEIKTTYPEDINVTLNNACFNQSILQLKINASNLANTIKAFCYNGSQWIELYNFADSGVDGIFEEAMWWNIPTINIPRIGNIQVPIKYTADNWGILNTHGLALSVLTDYNYTFTGWSTSSVSNMTKTVKLIWSNYSRTFSGNTKEPVFIGTSLAKQNIQPYGQTSTKPGINFTYKAREQCMNISMYTNATYPCMNITISSTNNKSQGWFFNTTNPNNFITNFCNGTVGLWMWADKNASCAQQIRPYWFYSAKCTGCV